MFVGMHLNMIVAIDKKTGGIGYKGKLPWRCPDDMRFFREMTLDNICFCGYKTYRAMPPLNRRTVVPVSRDGRGVSFTIEDLESYLGFANAFNNGISMGELFLIGGAELYLKFLKDGKVDTVYLSEIEFKNKEYEYDTYFQYPFDEFEKEEIRSVSTDDYELKIYKLTLK